MCWILLIWAFHPVMEKPSKSWVSRETSCWKVLHTLSIPFSPFGSFLWPRHGYNILLEAIVSTKKAVLLLRGGTVATQQLIKITHLHGKSWGNLGCRRGMSRRGAALWIEHLSLLWAPQFGCRIPSAGRVPRFRLWPSAVSGCFWRRPFGKLT